MRAERPGHTLQATALVNEAFLRLTDARRIRWQDCAHFLVTEYSTDPIWAPNGQFLVYSGADVGTIFSVKAVTVDGATHDLPNLILTRGARRLAFLGKDALIIMKGDISHKEFWVFDLKTGRERQLTRLSRGFVVGDFDISPDGRGIIFDRGQEESDIVLFELR
jgi:Tol biopolymer transport system component